LSPEILFIICLLQGYLLGSINSSIIVGKFHGIDIRSHGSGNAGMTNTLRTLGKTSAIIVILGDVLKGVFACVIGSILLDSFFDFTAAGLLAGGIGALFGHNWPLYFGFRGGKGVLTTITVILMMDWRIGIILIGVFVLTVAFTRFISLGSVLAAILFSIISVFFRDFFGRDMLFSVFAVLVSAIVIIKHVSNIERLIKGQENKFSLKKNNKLDNIESKMGETA
jgi:glycerol-3-phosphate acyltransferase PlsY